MQLGRITRELPLQWLAGAPPSKEFLKMVVGLHDVLQVGRLKIGSCITCTLALHGGALLGNMSERLRLCAIMLPQPPSS